jgi:hypothetical protein
MRFMVRSVWLILVSLVICLGVLQCFSPETLRRIQNRLGRALELRGPGERALRNGRASEASLLHRAFGFLLILIGLLLLLVTLGLIR